MYCTNCGAKLNDNDSFCDQCGTAVVRKASTPLPPSNAVVPPSNAAIPPTNAVGYSHGYDGYSQRVDSAEVKAYQAKIGRWTNIFLCLMVILPIVIICIYASYTGKMTIPEALGYGAVLSLIMFCFGITPTIKRKMQKSYIGTVIDMREKIRVESDEDGGSDRIITTYYIVTRDTNGKKHTHKSTGYAGIYSFLKVGDEIRYLPQFPIPFEKKKSPGDTHTCCLFCQNIVSLDDDICSYCKAPVLR